MRALYAVVVTGPITFAVHAACQQRYSGTHHLIYPDAPLPIIWDIPFNETDKENEEGQ